MVYDDGILVPTFMMWPILYDLDRYVKAGGY